MKRLATTVLAFSITVPVFAQRAAGHAGFASRGPGVSRAAPAFRGSFAPSSSMRYGGMPVTRFARPPIPRFAAPSFRSANIAPPVRRPSFYQNQKNHTFYSGNHHPRIYTYPVGVVGFFPPDLLASDLYGPGYFGEPYYDDSAYAQLSAPPPDYSSNGYPYYGYPEPSYPAAGYPEASYPEPPAGYQPYPGQQPEPYEQATVTPEMQYVPGSADTVTLIFKDGRPPEQIQNYIATSKTVTVINGSRHYEIPVADLDVPATIKANRETGVGFSLPATNP